MFCNIYSVKFTTVTKNAMNIKYESKICSQKVSIGTPFGFYRFAIRFISSIMALAKASACSCVGASE